MLEMSFLAHLNPAGKILYDLLAFLPWDRFYCWFDLCFQVWNTLGLVSTYLVLNTSPKIKTWGFKSDDYSDYQSVRKTPLYTCSMILLRCMGWNRPARTTGGPWLTLFVDQVLSILGITWKYRSVLIVTQCSLSSLNQNAMFENGNPGSTA